MQNDQSDLELIFKKRARRRLVGAIALVLIMIVILPLLLKDRSSSDAAPEIAIIMPDTTAVDVLDYAAEASRNGETVEGELDPFVEPVVIDPEETTKQEETTKNIASPRASKPKEVVKIVENQQAIPKTSLTNNNTPFYVQIGVFSELGNIKKLQEKLTELGYATVTENVATQTGVKMRLRTANFNNKNDAIIALENIKDAGLTGMVVSQK